MLKKGDGGEQVRLLQEKIGAGIDGDFGKNTEIKVKEFQKLNKLPQTGIVDDVMLGMLGMSVVQKNGITEAQYQEAADLIGCDVASVKAVDKIEASGNGFLANGDVKILFEPHVFWRELVAKGYDPHKHLFGNADILYQKWKTGFYGTSSIQWGKMNRACKINTSAALKSASYGRFQIMGNNYKACGYNSVEEFVAAMKESEYNHLKAFISFVKTNRLDRYLVTKNWAKFAEGYNGSGYKANKYDTKLFDAYNYFSKQ